MYALVNGIRTHGENNIDLVGHDLRRWGHPVVDIKLPWRSVVSARWGGRRDARIIAHATRDGDILVCHSYGCYRGALAMKLRNYKHVYMIAPAMSKDWEFSDPSKVTCFHSRKDVVIKLGACLWLHPFGIAGVTGFTQKGVENVKMKSDHNDYFDGRLRTKVVRHILKS